MAVRRSHLAAVVVTVGMVAACVTRNVCAAEGAGAVQADDFWKFYQKHPQFQAYYPFGIYGDQGCWTRFGTDPKVFSRMTYNIVREAGMNAIWGANLHRNLVAL